MYNLTFESESSNDLDSKLSGWNRIKLVKFTRNNLKKFMASKFRFILHSECLYVCIGNDVWSKEVLNSVRWGIIMNMDSHPYSWWNLRCHFMILLLTGCRGYDLTLPRNRRIGCNKTEKHFSLELRNLQVGKSNK